MTLVTKPSPLLTTRLAAVLVVLMSVLALSVTEVPRRADAACARSGKLNASQLNAAFSQPGLGANGALEGFGGGDYQHAYPLPDGRVLWLFQDTYFSNDNDLNEPLNNAAHNVGMVQDGTCFTILGGQGLDFVGNEQTIDSGRWFWPLDGEIGFDGKLWIYFVEMVNPAGTGANPGALPVRNWLAILDPVTLQQLHFAPAIASTPRLYGWSIASNDQYSYLYGHCYRQFLNPVVGPEQFDSNCMPYVYLARVPLGHFDVKPEYWNGTGWSPNANTAAAISGRGKANPMSVQWFGDVWVSVTKIDDWWGDVIYVDSAPAPEGPWTTVQTIPVAKDRKCQQGCGNYSAFLMPWLDSAGNMVIGLSNGADYALWLANGSLYRPTFYTAPVPSAVPGRSAASPPLFPQAVGTAGFVAVDPVRLIDTREPYQQFGRMSAGSVAELNLNSFGVPPGATAVALNLTADQPSVDGYVRVYPCSQPEPQTSNVNPIVGQAQTNGLVVPIGDGRLCLRTLTAVDIVIDLNGWLTTTSDVGLQPVAPRRLIDTRFGLGGSGRLRAQQTLEVPVVAAGSLATAVSLNITAVNPTRAGFVTAWPCGSSRPLVSNLNPQPGITQPNLVTVRVGAGGKVCLFTAHETDLVVDVLAEYQPGASARYAALPPQRLLDSRGQDSPRHQSNLSYILAMGNVVAAQVNLTATEAQGAGFLTGYRCLTDQWPGTSNVNYLPILASANSAILTSSRGYTCVFASSPTHLVLDIFGVWTKP